MNKGIRLIPAIFGIIGIVLIIAGIITTKNDESFMKTAKETTGSITDIYISRDSDGNESGTIYVAFRVNNKNYLEKSAYWSSSMRKGDTIKVYYNPSNPREFKVKGEAFFVPLIMFFIGVPFLLVGIIPISYDIYKNKMSNELINNGRLIYANIDDIKENTSIEVNGFNPYVIICSWKDSDGGLYNFKSKNLYFNPSRLLEGKTTISVYMDENNPKRYFVDTRDIESAVKN